MNYEREAGPDGTRTTGAPVLGPMGVCRNSEGERPNDATPAACRPRLVRAPICDDGWDGPQHDLEIQT